MKYRLIASALVLAVLAALVVTTSEPSTPFVSAPSSADDSSLKSFKMP